MVRSTDHLQLHPEDVKPNFHWVTHIFDQISDYGAVYNVWTFLFERLNKTLKSYGVNGHEGGEVEVSFFRAFSRDVALRDMVWPIFIPVSAIFTYSDHPPSPHSS